MLPMISYGPSEVNECTKISGIINVQDCNWQQQPFLCHLLSKYQLLPVPEALSLIYSIPVLSVHQIQKSNTCYLIFNQMISSSLHN